MKTLSVGAKLFHVEDRRVDSHDEFDTGFSQFYDRA